MVYIMAGQAAIASGVVSIFMSPNGSDENSGADSAIPVKTLLRVKTLTAKALAAGATEINVNIAPGTYKGQSIIWDLAAPNANIKITGVSSNDERPIFDGASASGNFWLTLPPPKQGSRAIETNLTISNIVVRNYCEGISFGNYRSKTQIANNNLSNIWFDQIGTKYESKTVQNRGLCVAAVRLQRAENTTLTQLKFTNIENLPQSKTEANRYGPLALHAIYIADRSSNVDISKSEFSRFTGSPIRIRNRSDNVVISQSRFREPLYVKNSATQRAYVLSAVSQWNCTTQNKACAKKKDECPSRNLKMNDLDIGDGLNTYNDETQGPRHSPTCGDQALLREYSSSTAGFKVQVPSK